MSAAVWAIPLLTAGILLAGLLKGTDLLSAFAKGAARGLESARSLLPSLILFMTAIGMFRASGALEVLSYALRPLAKAVGLPEEVVPLALLRPVSARPSCQRDPKRFGDHLLHHRPLYLRRQAQEEPPRPALLPDRRSDGDPHRRSLSPPVSLK